MQTYQCECGKSQSWGSMHPDACRGCSECGTRLEWCPKVEGEAGQVWLPKPGNYRQPEPHQWVIRYHERTGIQYQRCDRCLVERDSVPVEG